MAAYNEKTNLIINYLPPQWTNKDLYVSSLALVRNRVMKDGKTGLSYGFGFVEYCRPEDGAEGIRKLNGVEVLNKRIKVSYARPSGDDIKDTNLYITNLPRNMTEQGLMNLCSHYRKIVQLTLLRNHVTGRP